MAASEFASKLLRRGIADWRLLALSHNSWVRTEKTTCVKLVTAPTAKKHHEVSEKQEISSCPGLGLRVLNCFCSDRSPQEAAGATQRWCMSWINNTAEDEGLSQSKPGLPPPARGAGVKNMASGGRHHLARRQVQHRFEERFGHACS